MGGINGIFVTRDQCESDFVVLRRMNESRRYRGAVECGSRIQPVVGFRPCRLSVFDLFIGWHRLYKEDCRACVAANDEIYNRRELSSGFNDSGTRDHSPTICAKLMFDAFLGINLETVRS